MSNKQIANGKLQVGAGRKFWLLKMDLYLWLTLLLSLPVIGPLLQPGYFWGAHDARHSVYFLHQFDKVIRDGVWYPRWIPDMAFGYGYPFFNVYGTLPFYGGELLLRAGLDMVSAVKILFGLSAILSGLTMYLFVRRLLGQPAGLVAALTYVYLPYHLFDLYVRADLAESVAFVFVPLVLWGFYRAVTQPRLAVMLWTALAYAALMFTHSLSAFILTAILGLYVAYMIGGMFLTTVGRSGSAPANFFHRGENRRTSPPQGGIEGGLSAKPGIAGAPWIRTFGWQIIHAGWPPLFTLLLGLSLSAMYLLPALAEAGYVRTDQWFGGRFAFGEDFVEVFQLFSPRWGFGASIPGPNDETGFQIGLAAVLLFMLSFLIVPKLVNPLVRRTLYFFQGTTLAMAFLTVPLSAFVWNLLPLAQLVQFPWRLLVVIAPYIAIVAGTIAAKVGGQGSGAGDQESGIDRQVPVSVMILSCLILLSSYPYVRAEIRDPKPTEGPVSEAALFRFQQSADEMTGQTAWVRRIPNWSTLAEQVIAGGAITTKVNYAALPADNSVGVYSMKMDSQHEFLWVGTDKEGQSVTFMIPYYPGWQATIYEDLGPHDGNLDEEIGPVTRIGPVVARPAISTTYLEGWMVVPIPPGPHFLELRFEDTPVRIVGRWVSMLSLLGVVGLFIVACRRRRDAEDEKIFI
ncbi:MAG: glycosyltransferase family 39 protein [Anaerolineae bacterium]|nr:glycosyltransferase family 39 protein [Anaerolineae bacterium]